MKYQTYILLLLVFAACKKEEPQGFVTVETLIGPTENCAEGIQNREVAFFTGESNFLGFSGVAVAAQMDDAFSPEISDESFLVFNHWNTDKCSSYGRFLLFNVSSDMEGDTVEISPRRPNDLEDGVLTGTYDISAFIGLGYSVIEEYDVLPMDSHKSWIYIERVNQWESEWEGSMQLVLYSTFAGGRWDDPNRPDTMFIKNVRFVANKFE